MSVYLASDWHLGHRLAAQERGFASVEEHDERILSEARAVLTKRTKLFVLGDVAFGSAALARLREVPGVKALVLGNHDLFRASRYLEFFNDLHGALCYRDFLLTHVPVMAQSQRYRANLHGHRHDHVTPEELSPWHLNLMAERWDFKPVPFDLIAERFSPSSGVSAGAQGEGEA